MFKHRIPFYDFIRGFLILKMILDHILFTWGLNKLYVWAVYILNVLATTFLFPFWMGVSAGYFRLSNKRLFKRGIQLIVYFFVFNIIVNLLFSRHINWMQVVLNNNSSFPSFEILWSLGIASFFLIFIKFVLFQCQKIKFCKEHQNNIYTVFLFLTSWILLIIPYNYNIYTLLVTFIGFLLANLTTLHKSHKFYAFSVLWIPLIFILTQKCCVYHPFLMISILTSLVPLLSYIVNQKEQSLPIQWIIFVGRNTMFFYIMQIILFRILYFVFPSLINSWLQVIILYGFTVFVLTIMLKFTKKNKYLNILSNLIFRV